MTDHTKERIKHQLRSSRVTRMFYPLASAFYHMFRNKQLEAKGKKAFKRDRDMYIRMNKGKNRFGLFHFMKA